jgi:hypothetical protein
MADASACSAADGNGGALMRWPARIDDWLQYDWSARTSRWQRADFAGHPGVITTANLAPLPLRFQLKPDRERTEE